MQKTAWIISFKLKSGITDQEFIAATKLLHDNVISKASGFISWQQYVQGDIWTDFVLWETLQDAKNATKAGSKTSEAKNFYAMLQMNTCKMLTAPLKIQY